MMQEDLYPGEVGVSMGVVIHVSSFTTYINQAFICHYTYKLPEPLIRPLDADRWFDPFRLPTTMVKSLGHHAAFTMRRSPARKCASDARRWKRRRFLQRLAA
jgi:hypothetical protein